MASEEWPSYFWGCVSVAGNSCKPIQSESGPLARCQQSESWRTWAEQNWWELGSCSMASTGPWGAAAGWSQPGWALLGCGSRVGCQAVGNNAFPLAFFLTGLYWYWMLLEKSFCVWAVCKLQLTYFFRCGKWQTNTLHCVHQGSWKSTTGCAVQQLSAGRGGDGSGYHWQLWLFPHC